MFQFTGFPPHTLCIQAWVTGHDSCGVSPFGYLWINTFVQLPRAFRRLRVLLRQLIPRHSSYTLISFNTLALSSARYLRFLLKSLCNFQSAFIAGRVSFEPLTREYDTSADSPCQGFEKNFEILRRNLISLRLESLGRAQS